MKPIALLVILALAISCSQKDEQEDPIKNGSWRKHNIAKAFEFKNDSTVSFFCPIDSNLVEIEGKLSYDHSIAFMKLTEGSVIPLFDFNIEKKSFRNIQFAQSNRSFNYQLWKDESFYDEGFKDTIHRFSFRNCDFMGYEGLNPIYFVSKELGVLSSTNGFYSNDTLIKVNSRRLGYHFNERLRGLDEFKIL